MATVSAGLIVFRRGATGDVEVLLVHPGGPYWATKDVGAWSIPKGEFGHGESAIDVARREFVEELGVEPPDGPWIELGEIRQRGGKRVLAWAVEGDLEVSNITSNTVEIEWPPRSGRRREIPEVDRAEWFATTEAKYKLVAAQAELLYRLVSSI